eukprot:1149747-Pelagomonas_calceolata.AAC.1
MELENPLFQSQDNQPPDTQTHTKAQDTRERRTRKRYNSHTCTRHNPHPSPSHTPPTGPIPGPHLDPTSWGQEAQREPSPQNTPRIPHTTYFNPMPLTTEHTGH